MALSLLLLFIDSFTSWLQPVKSWLAEVTVPIHWVANIPARVNEFGESATIPRRELEMENDRLKAELMIHKGRLQRMSEVSAENTRLRNLLNATELLEDRVLVAELIGESPDTQRHTILINRGENDGVFVGQPVLDADGLMGQVVEVFRASSKVLLVTDSAHALPVQIVRNGMRSIIEGSSHYHKLRLRHVPPSMDIKVGDQLVSSGLGGRFPVGYPVGTVTSVQANTGHAYLDVLLEPAAKVDRSRHLMVVFSTVKSFDNPLLNSSTSNTEGVVDKNGNATVGSTSIPPSNNVPTSSSEGQ